MLPLVGEELHAQRVAVAAFLPLVLHPFGKLYSPRPPLLPGQLGAVTVLPAPIPQHLNARSGTPGPSTPVEAHTRMSQVTSCIL